MRACVNAWIAVGLVCGVVMRSRLSVCLCVCNVVTFESLYLENSFWYASIHFQNFQVKLAYQGHRVIVKVTGAITARLCVQALAN